jgi:N-acetyl-gamma-glutamyl-phosphate reductase
LLPLLPLIHAGIITAEHIVIDAKSGVTGAGRVEKRAFGFSEISEGMSAYGVCNHRHMAELEQELSASKGAEVQVAFTPHLIPMRRGMLTTIYANLQSGKTADDARAALAKTYKNEPFVQVVEAGKAPATHHVRGSNQCHIGLFAGRHAGQVVLVSVIDNLIKGASGQAIQNMNVMFGFPETLGLELSPMFP